MTVTTERAAAGATTAPDGRRMSINVEVVGTIIVQHYVEEIAEPGHHSLQTRLSLVQSVSWHL